MALVPSRSMSPIGIPGPGSEIRPVDARADPACVGGDSTAAIDLHAHFAPAAALARHGWLEREGRAVRVRVGESWQAVPAALLDPELLLTDMDANGISARAVSLPPFLLRHDLPVHQATSYSRAANEGLAAVARTLGRRVRWYATVPLQDPQGAVDEVKRAAGEWGCAGVAIATNVAGRLELDDPVLEPFWTVTESMGVLVFLHPHDVAGAERMGRYHLRNLIGNPVETALAGARLIFGGVLARHPGLRVLLSHGGGALPSLVGRLDHGFRVRPECRSFDAPPSASARRFYYDTIVFEPRALRALVDWVGPTRVVLGTDYPFDMGDATATATVARAIDDPDSRRAVLRSNAVGLLEGPDGDR